MKPQPSAQSIKAKCILDNWDNITSQKCQFIIIYLDETLARTEKEKRSLEEEIQDLKTEVEQLRKTIHRVFESK